MSFPAIDRMSGNMCDLHTLKNLYFSYLLHQSLFLNKSTKYLTLHTVLIVPFHLLHPSLEIFITRGCISETIFSAEM